MTGSTRAASWTGLLAGAVAHDINNFVQGLSSARAMAGAPGAALTDAAETAAIIEDDLEQLRKLGVRLRALASARERDAFTRLGDACADACAEVDGRPGQVSTGPIPAELRVVGTAAALTTAIAALLEHAVAASPAAAAVSLAVTGPPVVGRGAAEGAARLSPGSPVTVEIAAPEAWALGAIGKTRLDVLLATSWSELRGDTRLVMAGAIADAIDGEIYVASDPKAGLVLALHLVACPGPEQHPPRHG